MWRVALLAWFSVSAGAAATESPSDRAISHVLRRAQPYVQHVEIWRRQQVTDTLDVVVARGSERDPASAEARVSGPGVQPVGLFLQERTVRGLVFTLAMTRLPCEMTALLHLSDRAVVFACENEKNQRSHEKFVYDVNARALVNAFSYQPYSVTSLRNEAGLVVVGATNGQQRIIADFDPGREPAWGVRRRLAVGEEEISARCSSASTPSAPFGPGGAFQLVALAKPFPDGSESVVRERRGTTIRHHRLRPSSDSEYIAARGHEYRDLRPDDVHISEDIGPYHVFGDELWVGRSFYDGEGNSGVGAIAMFDVSLQRFSVFTAPLTAGWSVSAIHADARSVWLSRVIHGELGTMGGGLVRFDRATRTFEHVTDSLRIGCRFVAADGRLFHGTNAGVTIIQGDEISHVMFDETSDGRVRLVISEQ